LPYPVLYREGGPYTSAGYAGSAGGRKPPRAPTAAAVPGGARSGDFRKDIRLFSESAGSDPNGGMPALPLVITVRAPSSPRRLTAVSIAGPRSPLRFGPWQSWQFCSYTARPMRSGVGGPPSLARPPGVAAPASRLGIKPPVFAAVDWPSGTSFTIDGRSFDSTYTVPFVGSAPVEKNKAPPFTLGRLIVSFVIDGGV